MIAENYVCPICGYTMNKDKEDGEYILKCHYCGVYTPYYDNPDDMNKAYDHAEEELALALRQEFSARLKEGEHADVQRLLFNYMKAKSNSRLLHRFVKIVMAR